jgi:hypothetical protein
LSTVVWEPQAERERDREGKMHVVILLLQAYKQACRTSYSSYSCAHVPSSLQLTHTHKHTQSLRERIHRSLTFVPWKSPD